MSYSILIKFHIIAYILKETFGYQLVDGMKWKMTQPFEAIVMKLLCIAYINFHGSLVDLY